MFRAEQIQSAVQTADDDGQVVVMVMSAQAARSLFGGIGAESEGCVRDLTLDEAGEWLNPKNPLKERSVAELCRQGYFPDTVLPDGSKIRGAYQDRGSWWITREGLAAAQERNRRRPPPGKTAAADHQTARPSTGPHPAPPVTDSATRQAAVEPSEEAQSGTSAVGALPAKGITDPAADVDPAEEAKASRTPASGSAPRQADLPPRQRYSQSELKRRNTLPWERSR